MTAKSETEHYRARAEREIALAQAAGAAKAYASADHRTVFVERRDGTREIVRMPARSAT